MSDYEWIPCEKRLPEKYGWYLATMGGKVNQFTLMVIYTEDGWKSHHYVSLPEGYVKAWCRLPEPYKEDGDNE